VVSSFAKILKTVIRRPRFWLILFLLIIITTLYYWGIRSRPPFATDILTGIGLTRHAFERILYLIPIFLAGFFFGWKSSLTVSVVAVALMIPRSLYLSPYPADALFETGAVFVVGVVLTVTFRALHQDKEQLSEFATNHEKLKKSEERYRQLFENAHDASLIHNPEGNIVSANKTCLMLTGYELTELTGMKMNGLLTEESGLMVEAIEQILVSGQNTDWTTEVRLVKKSKSESLVQLSIGVIRNGDKSLAFLCTARNVSEQRRIQENLQYYLQQATRAQEEERKRIALELHDETIQDLIVLSRQLDILATKGKEMSPENSLLLKESQQLTKNIIQSLRNLSQDLRPAILDRLGLLPALDHLAAGIAKISGIAIRVHVIGAEPHLPEEEKLVLFRITQEALRNVWKHSRANKADVTVEFSEQKVRLTIRDDGKGFYVPEKINELSKDGKLGLVGMQERARLIDGHLLIQSEPGKGTLITVEALI
jgi:two-component system sensor histidine kinase DegS